MEKPAHTILVCGSFRAGGEPQGICHKKNGGLLGYLESEVSDRGLDALVTATSCLKLCDHGPALVVQPQNWWYGGVASEEDIDEILDALEEGQPCQARLLA
ncbi:MAG: (2Fe-2S) ferredoxin domain-containing protein [Deltaproteobacteria bacterium]|nr:(2Fe-2S) ferredoxin domain-containing protein [Deltaproteobacteria bacterium]